MNRFITIISSITIPLGFVVAAHATTPADKCESGKLKESAKFASCRLKAEAKAVVKGGAPDNAKCFPNLDGKFAGLEAKAGLGVCPSEMDSLTIDARITSATDDVVILLAGGTLPDCNADLTTCSADLSTCNTDLATCGGDLTTCDGDLTTCEGDLTACEALPAALPLVTGQITCHNTAGTLIPCAGTGHDGEFQFGVARSYTNNGDGTITDNATGLMWERLSDDGSIHDYDTTYDWAGAFSKVTTLNTMSFAGYNDWRLPNVRELESLRDFEGEGGPLAVDPWFFNSNCVPTCTVLTCSCTKPAGYWSSTTFRFAVNIAYNVNFEYGFSRAELTKETFRFVRAVRTAS